MLGTQWRELSSHCSFTEGTLEPELHSDRGPPSCQVYWQNKSLVGSGQHSEKSASLTLGCRKGQQTKAEVFSRQETNAPFLRLSPTGSMRHFRLGTRSPAKLPQPLPPRPSSAQAEPEANLLLKEDPCVLGS